MILDPRAIGLTLVQESRVALTVATSLVGAIRASYQYCRPGIRWPNDIEVGGRKLGGILPERSESADGPRLLIGIGLNVRTRLEDAPDEVRRMAATLAEWDEKVPSSDPITSLLRGILARFRYPLASLAVDGDDQPRRWNQLDQLAGSSVRVAVGPEVIEGVADGIDRSGGPPDHPRRPIANRSRRARAPRLSVAVPSTAFPIEATCRNDRWLRLGRTSTTVTGC